MCLQGVYAILCVRSVIRVVTKVVYKKNSYISLVTTKLKYLISTRVRLECSHVFTGSRTLTELYLLIMEFYCCYHCCYYLRIYQSVEDLYLLIMEFSCRYHSCYNLRIYQSAEDLYLLIVEFSCRYHCCYNLRIYESAEDLPFYLLHANLTTFRRYIPSPAIVDYTSNKTHLPFHLPLLSRKNYISLSS